MKLKSLEINGFKSFADKVYMDFEDSVTAIVGPNGSGKSNVSDAVRWVLGEQSAKMLRGSKMEDVIFSGTEDKAQKNSAQVTITFDNTSGLIPIDYKEVSVSRKLYRTGESEYFLNKTNVRLKEIRELFLDTGIGKEGYSIISQGKIEEIVNGKSDERRAIFDEASGIAKIKYKKIESERKLEKSKDNLIRLKDIITQNEERYSYLKIQSEKAKKAKILNENIEKIDFSQSYSRYNFLKEKISFFEKNIEDLNEKLNSIIIKKDEIEKVTNPLNEEINNLNDILKDEESKYDFELKVNSESKNKSDILIERNNNIILNIENLEKNIDELQKNINSFNIQIEDKDKIIFSKKEEGVILNKTKNDLIEKLNSEKLVINSINEKFNEFSVLKENLTNNISLLEAEKKASELFREQNLIIKKENDEKLKNLLENSNNLSLDIENQGFLINKSNLEIEKLNLSILEYNNKKVDFSKKYESSSNEINRINSELIYKKKEYELINNHIKNYDGYNKSIQDLIKLTDREKVLKSLVLGTLGDLIEVDEKFRKAIDTALSSNLQGIVVKNEEDAKLLIEKMKINKISRINFFPINKIKSSKVEMVMDKDILSFANLTVNCNTEYREIIDYFLNKTIICENMDIAIKLSRKYKNKYRILTLDGDIINTWGSISGGYKSNKNNFSVLGRKEQLNKIKLELDELENSLNENTDSINLIKLEVKEINAILEKLNSQYNNLIDENKIYKEELTKLEIKKEVVLNEISKISNIENSEVHFDYKKEEQLKNLKTEFETITQKLEEIITEKEKYEQILLEIEKKQYMLNNDIDILERDINLVLNSKYDLLENQNSLQSKNSYNLTELDRLKKDFEINKKQSEEYLLKYKNSEIKLLDLKNSISEKREKVKTFEEKLYSSNEELNNIKINILEFQKDIESDINKLESYRLEHKNIISRLCEEYLIDENECEINMEKYKDELGTKSELKKLKQDLKNLGSYSYDSIEEFEKVDSELSFQKSQEIDLNNAISDINSILKKLEKEMKLAFVKEFEVINRNFSEIFKKLFNGGEARLELDGEDILTSGIEIVARPFGKKMQSLSLMSGGEKSLTAIALLFAIFETRPSPFCLLDEIDASLDDSNILRYTNYLKKFLDEVQFIMITHRKPTMEMANMIYGVTMEKKGISKIVSMKFDS